MSNGGFSITISAFDGFTKTIDVFNKKILAMQAPIVRMNASFNKAMDVTGLTKLGSAVSRVGGQVARLAKQAESVVPALGGITGAVSIAGVYKMAEAFGDFGTRLGNTAANVGIGVSSLHALSGAALLAGSSGDALTSGMVNLSQAITDAAGGQNQQALGYFRQLGIEIRNADGSLRRADQILPEVADKIAAISNPALQRRVANAFGLSDDLLPFLRRGAAGMREYEEAARRYGVLNEDGVRAAGDMREAQSKLTLSVLGLGNAIAEKLSPVIAPLLTGLADWIAAHRTNIAEAIGKIAKQFEDWVKGGGIKLLTAQIGELFTKVDSVIEKFGDWGSAAILLGGLLTVNVLAPVISLVAKLGALTAIRLPLWVSSLLGVPLTTLALPLALHGDEADNDPANAARQQLVYDQTTDYINNTRFGQSGRGRRDSGTSSYEPGRSGAASANSNARDLYQRLIGMGWTGPQAAGLVANLQQESSLNPNRTGDHGQAYGIGQWHPDRQAAFAAWAGHDIHGTSAEEQLAFLNYELRQGREQDAGRRLSQATLPGEAGDIVSQYYLRPGDRYGEAQRRAGMAAQLYNQVGRQPVAGPYTPAPAVATPAAPGAPGAPGAVGTVKTEIVIRGAPAGSSAHTITTGNVSASARIESPQLMGAYP